ncbi:hypothetical protein EVB55_025 [Rhizobium phage RHph_Y68]|uniref:Uncharacterized protein n=1 Tax=Rhizobium phage RHph_Y68 TaxID=2509787 RepID=A0A7S5R4T6_9CAUD|nr:hypothetical protein PP934_gp025 [Rhizobium phage RHph_Y68]QIG67960.1 hypothetical protein EVB55_025 [Rhizobium phage RHph_Y68]
MFASWLKILPYFVVVFFAKRYCERFSHFKGVETVVPFSSGETISWIETEATGSSSD